MLAPAPLASASLFAKFLYADNMGENCSPMSGDTKLMEEIMRNVVRLIAVSCLLMPLSAHSETRSPGAPAVPELNLPALGIPEPAEKACSVVYPVAGDDYVTTSVNTPVDFRPLDNDTDTPDQDLKGFGQPQHGTVVLSGGIDGMTYTPDPGYVGSDSFTYTLGGCLQCSGSGSSAWCSEPEFAEGTVYITVTN